MDSLCITCGKENNALASMVNQPCNRVYALISELHVQYSTVKVFISRQV